MGAVPVTEGGLAGRTVGSVGGIVAIRGRDDSLTTIPPRDRILEAGEAAVVIASPGRLRELESAGEPAPGPADGTDGV
jgi:Trk K+ transport system NAD-binding subunit